MVSIIILVLFFLSKSSTKPPLEYSLSPFPEFQCYIGQTEDYTCPDGSTFLNCFCDDGNWLCIPDPAGYCEKAGYVSNVTENNVTVTNLTYWEARVEEEPIKIEEKIVETAFEIYGYEISWLILGLGIIGLIIFLSIILRGRR